MKDVVFMVLPSGDNNEIQTAFNTYFKDRDYKSLLNLAIRCLSRALYGTELWNIEFMVASKLYGAGEYDNGRIKISKELLKTPEQIQSMPLVIDTVFHELTHALLDLRNKKILLSRERLDKYLPIYNNGRIYEVFQNISNDMEYSAAATRYYYQQNKNEYMARRVAYEQLNEYLLAFAEGVDFNLPTFQQKEQDFQDLLYKAFPLFRGNEYHASGMIKQYQAKIIQNLVKATNNEISNLIATINVILDHETKHKLVESCAKCGNFEITKIILSTPQILLTKQEKQMLCNAYDEQEIEKEFFYEQAEKAI